MNGWKSQHEYIDILSVVLYSCDHSFCPYFVFITTTSSPHFSQSHPLQSIRQCSQSWNLFPTVQSQPINGQSSELQEGLQSKKKKSQSSELQEGLQSKKKSQSSKLQDGLQSKNKNIMNTGNNSLFFRSCKLYLYGMSRIPNALE
jgi:hypothetical protein